MDLARTQFMSLLTKAFTTFCGIAQSIIIVRILSPGQYGIVGLVTSIGGVIGVTQHLGIVDGAIREIAVLKDRKDSGTVFWVSHIVRQIVTIPLSIGLVLLAGFIATHIYHRPNITLFIQLYAAVLVLQGLQDVLGATLTGLKKFSALYIIQVITAAINVVAFGFLTWKYHTLGFFIAVIVTTSIMVLMLAGTVIRELKGNLRFPEWSGIRKYTRRVMRIGVYMYMSRIFFVIWQQLPILILGGTLAAEQLGYINMSLSFGSKLTIIAMALSEVNLSWMSSLFATNPEEFKEVVTRNMHRVLLLMMTMALGLLFFSHEILLYIIGHGYLPAQPIILLITTAFFLYSLVDIGTSSVFVPADEPRSRAVIFGAMAAVTGSIVGWLLWKKPDALHASFGVLAGAIVAYVLTVILAKRKFGINLLTKQLALFLVALLVSLVWLFTAPGFIIRLLVFIVLTSYIVWEAHRSKLMPEAIMKLTDRRSVQKRANTDITIVCFAGAPFDQLGWTNRQHIMSRVSQTYPVLYIEPRMWIVRYIWQHLKNPKHMLAYMKRLVWFGKRSEHLYIKAQWNLIPGSREIGVIGWLNHALNRFNVLAIAWWLGFRTGRHIMWIYDTEAAEYLSAFNDSLVVYDCVDDHAAQAGPNRNANKVRQEEKQILKRADLVTVTSKRLLEQKQEYNSNTYLVANVGNVEPFLQSSPNSPLPAAIANIPHPMLGSVGALDSYKYDFDLISTIAKQRLDWHFVFIGEPIVEHNNEAFKAMSNLPNIHCIGAVPQAQVPEYTTQFDVCLIPYRANEYNAASIPLKFWEFMATGKPIVVSGLPELLEYRQYINYAETADQFITGIERALATAHEGNQERRSLAAQHSWDKRVTDLLGFVHQAINKKWTNL